MGLKSELLLKINELIRRCDQLIIRRRTSYLFLILLVFLHFYINVLPISEHVRTSFNYKIEELDNDGKDLFFVSAYYYGTEYSELENKVSLTFVAPRDSFWDRRKIIAIRTNGEKYALEHLKLHRATPHNVCKYVTLVGTVALKDELLNLEISVNRYMVKIEYRPADKVERELVVCTPPIYNNVRWQNVLIAVHIYSRFNGHLQAYLSNSNLPFYELLEELKRLKGISVDAFPDFYGNLSILDEIEFGGVTVANADCLNKYKKSANFITFLEWNEVILPKTSDSYLSEFFNYFESDIYVGLLEFKNEKGISKIVTKPTLIDSVWLNEPVQRRYKLKSKHMNDTKIYEIKETKDLHSIIRGKFPGSEILKARDRQEIGTAIKKTIANPIIAGLLGRLRDESKTLMICSKSFTTYYTELNYSECPGPHLCSIPITNMNFTCMKSDSHLELFNYTNNFYQIYSEKFVKSVC